MILSWLFASATRRLHLVLVLGLGVTGSARAGLLFSDNFSTSTQSNDVNFEYNVAPRQSGSVGPLQYFQGNDLASGTINGTITDEAGNFRTQVNNSGSNTLFLVGDVSGANNIVASVSPNHNFIEIPGLGSYLSISFTLDPAAGVSGTSQAWGGITLGAADNASFGPPGNGGTGARGQFISTSATHFGILFRDNGGYTAYDGATSVSTGSYTATPTTTLTHSFELRVSDPIDGNPWDGVNNTRIQVLADGASVYTYTTTNGTGYTSDFLTLQGYGEGGFAINQFDDFAVNSVTTVPEAEAYLLLPVAVVVSMWMRRRRKARA